MTRSSNLGLGIDWNFSNLVGQINSRGESVIHEIGMFCTCMNEDTHAGQIERTHVPRQRTVYRCPICGGKGRIYRNSKNITAIITDIREDKTRLEEGWLVPGDCIMSVKPGHTVAAGDRITFTWAHPLSDGQVIVRGAGTSSENSSRKTGLDANEDRLIYRAESALWCEDEDGNTYEDGADFILDGSKIIRWVSGGPVKNKSYVIKYNAYLEWEAFAPPNVRRDRDRSLGDRVPLRKYHLVHQNDDPSASISDRVPFCSRFSDCT